MAGSTLEKMAPALDKVGWMVRNATGGLIDNHVGRLDHKLKAAGEMGGMTGTSMLGLQAVSAIIAPVVIVYLMINLNLGKGILQTPSQLLLYIALIWFGAYFPMMNLKERVAKRHKKIACTLPDVMDLLTISVEAGLDFMGALERVVENERPGPLRDELEVLFREIELGKTRSEALKDMGDRVQLSDLSNVVSSLVQADRLGSGLGGVMRAQSDMLRIRRGQRAEKAAMEAPVKMLAPLMICIFPCVFIMIFGPVVIQIFWDK